MLLYLLCVVFIMSIQKMPVVKCYPLPLTEIARAELRPYAEVERLTGDDVTEILPSTVFRHLVGTDCPVEEQNQFRSMVERMDRLCIGREIALMDGSKLTKHCHVVILANASNVTSCT